MATTEILQTGDDVQTTMNAPKEITARKSSKNRPKSLSLTPFDPNELSHKLSVVAMDKDDDSTDTNVSESQDSPKADQAKPAASPMTTLANEPPTKPSKSRNGSTSSRRGSFFNFSIKGSNYDLKKDDDAIPKPAPYRHVPKTAASQFVKTTTIEPLEDKAVVTRHAKSPGHGNSAMSLHDYNRQYRRTQSFSHGRPYDRHGAPHTVLESTAEVDEEGGQPISRLTLPSKLQSYSLTGETARRMSTGNIRARSTHQEVLEVPPPAAVRKDSTNMSVYRAASVSSTGDNVSPWFQSSGTATPSSRVDVDSRRGSETSGPSRRGSANAQRATMVDMYRVDWSPGRRRDSRWSIMRGRIGSVSKSSKDKREHGSESGESNPPESPTSPKTGFLGIFKR
ncbi:hypothetical protein B0J13DRAFT_223029 [Dactylonectria estremocensis]|uniref:Uncharacterized protein n=1 Tax=Dactylonectria estremocensis TaxID=1079267 RepID=A0A9P9JC84_9HYPO|nr:hypothetical protein B0J13DRAFT_223029 [Dactylonectria estremocensis]